MSKTTIPSGYRMPLSNNELQRAIELIHQEFQHSLCVRLNLHRVSAPLFVDGRTGLNDDLNGVERPVSFDIPDVGTDGQVVHSLAKWKRLALKRYEFPEGTGLYTNMNAIRRDEEVDNLHSIYVDQWDWEKHISPKDRNLLYLKETVRDMRHLRRSAQRLPCPDLQAGPGRVFHHHPGAGGPLSRPDPQRAGAGNLPQAPDCVPDADRQDPGLRPAPRRPGSGL